MYTKSETANQERSSYTKKYNSWRVRILYSVIIGYATFYFCRQNFNVAMPVLMDHFNATKIQFGWILTTSSIVYGVGKFCNGFISDRSNARIFMVCGLVAVGIITFLSGYATSIFSLGVLWILNNWFQSMGWPAVTRMLTHWFASKELGMKWALGTTSNQIGGAIAMIVCGYLVDIYGWETAFFIPGLVALLVSLFLFNRLRTSPHEVNLPIVEEYKECSVLSLNNTNYLSIRQLLKFVVLNKLMWYISIANMFIYIVRLGIIFWAPMFLCELKIVSLSHAGWQVALYEILGLIGSIIAGWMSDKLFYGRRGPVGVIFMSALTLTLILFWQIPVAHRLLSMVTLALAGFFVSGPHMLIGVANADFTNKQAIGTANGISGLFGYLGSALSGICVGWIIDNWGWDGVFLFFSFSAMFGTIFFALTWNYSASSICNENINK